MWKGKPLALALALAFAVAIVGVLAAKEVLTLLGSCILLNLLYGGGSCGKNFILLARSKKGATG